MRFSLSCLAVLCTLIPATAKDDSLPPTDFLFADESLKLPFAKDTPMVFVSRSTGAAEWNKLKSFWTDATEEVLEPGTGRKITRKVVKLKVPLGLSAGPAVPGENPMTLAKWELGKTLYFDPILSSNATISCSSCHSPAKGFTDQAKFSTGINGELGGINSPSVTNSGYNRLQFWDGRAGSLEEQAQGPVGNSKEMFAGKGDQWAAAIMRIRAKPDYVKAFQQVFGHLPTRDAAAKAIATYERTVLVGNSIYDRADVAMRKRITEDEGKPEQTAADYAQALNDAFASKDTSALAALRLDSEKDAPKAEATGKRLVNGRNIFFGKARCTNCHVGENFTDGAFHNIGVGAKDNKLPDTEFGRFAAQPTGHKDPTQVGAFKTPGLRALLDTAPYLHDGSEKTLEAVVEFYDRGGNANPFLDPKMRDTDAEAGYLLAKAVGKEFKGVQPALITRGNSPITPFKLNLTVDEKADLVLFLRALQSDPVDATIADATWFPKK